MTPNIEERSRLDRDDGRVVTSRVLITIKEVMRPELPTACQVCPSAMWFTEHGKRRDQLKVYCKVMRAVLWTTTDPINIMDCDGLDVPSEDEG